MLITQLSYRLHSFRSVVKSYDLTAFSDSLSYLKHDVSGFPQEFLVRDPLDKEIRQG
jgi:hypothetical protein